MPRPDPLPHLHAVAGALAAARPIEVFAALDRGTGAAIGHKLFTILLFHAESGHSERLYSNRPDAYPVGGRKPLNPTIWTREVGRNAADIRAAFFDHELIAGLGCASVLNLPVIAGGRLLGTINLLHEAEWYDDSDAPTGLLFAALAIPAYLAFVGQSPR
jgi:hypothetical protein